MKFKVYYCNELNDICVREVYDIPIHRWSLATMNKKEARFFGNCFIDHDEALIISHSENPMIYWRYECIGEFD